MNTMLMKSALRLSDVKRYHMVRTTSPQNVAEHSFRVAVIAANIAVLVGENPAAVAYVAMFHDVDEAIVGDTPSHVKAALKRKGVNPDDLSGILAETPIDWIIKAADMIESVDWLREHCAGSHAVDVLNSISDALDKFVCGLPEHHAGPVKVVASDVLSRLGTNFDLKWPDERE